MSTHASPDLRRARGTTTTSLPFGPYDPLHGPPVRSVPVTAVVLTRDEAPNIVRCLRSLQWCGQVVVMDSGSTDGTVGLAAQHGADVVHQSWLGFAAQREAALRADVVRHEWVYFVDADEWVSSALAREVAEALEGPYDAYRQLFRLVFQGRWIEHCGWYGASWIIRLGRRSAMSFASSAEYGERAAVAGPVGVLRHDLVDEDLKGLAAWLEKHVRYAQLEAARRAAAAAPLRVRVRRWVSGARGGRSPARSLAKDVIYPAVPARPLVLFLYMFVVRAGFRDGRAGALFCVLHAWHELVVQRLQRELAARSAQPLERDPAH